MEYFDCLYDDDPDWAEKGAVCPKCGSDSINDMETPVEGPGVGLMCDDCKHMWIFDFITGEEMMTKEQETKLKELGEELMNFSRNTKMISLGEFFEYFPEGDFYWDDIEAGDWHVYCCGESDCPIQWHKIAYSTEIGREGGKLFVEIWEVDEDGNWDFVTRYDEREGDRPEFWEEVGRMIANESDDYFFGWAKYWIDAARTGKDPAKMTHAPVIDNWIDFCIKNAEEEIKYLKK